jgi:hypothetical protein
MVSAEGNTGICELCRSAARAPLNYRTVACARSARMSKIKFSVGSLEIGEETSGLGDAASHRLS